jgi:hypothetical protein
MVGRDSSVLLCGLSVLLSTITFFCGFGLMYTLQPQACRHIILDHSLKMKHPSF